MLAHKLALRLGRTVRELLASIDAREWSSWEAFDEVSPIGDERGDRQAALVAWCLVNQWLEKGAKPVEQEALIPDYGGLRAEQERRRLKDPKYRARALARLRAQFRRAANHVQPDRSSDAEGRR